MQLYDLIHTEIFHAAAIDLTELSQPVLILQNIVIQVSCALIIQIILVRKVHQDDLGYLNRLIQIHRQHIVLVQVCNPQIVLDTEPVPFKIPAARPVPLNQLDADLLQETDILLLCVQADQTLIQKPGKALRSLDKI